MHKNGKFERIFMEFFCIFLLKIDNRKIENWIFFSLAHFCILFAFKPASKLFSMQVRKIDTSNPEAIKKVFIFFLLLSFLCKTKLMLHKCDGKRRIKLLFWIKDKVKFICSTFYAKNLSSFSIWLKVGLCNKNCCYF